MAEPVMFDLTDIEKALTEDVRHEYEGTCEFCQFPHLMLSKLGGVYLCDRCRNTITARIKESNHPFVAVRVSMDPAYAGKGKRGDRRKLPPPLGSLAEAIKREYGQKMLDEVQAHPLFQQFSKSLE